MTTSFDADTAVGFARELAGRISGFSFEDLPAAAVYWARMGILDTIGVTLAGSREEPALLVEVALNGSTGPALILGTHRRAGVLDAALINGTASHVLDFDDSNNTMGGHPSAPVISALMPLAEQLGSSGSEFVTAYIAGFEVEAKIGLAVNFHHYTKGWHPTATLGVFGAAAACAKLMRLDVHGTANALALAASFASGIKANFGTMAKPLHIGHCARNGLFAARLAASGFTANAANVFEHGQGFLDVFNGPGTYDAARAISAWANPLDIVEPGIAIKQYPCCGSTHPAVDAMLSLLNDHSVHPDEVERVDAAIHGRRLNHTNRPDPQSRLDAKFSLQYVLSRALLERRVSLAHFEGDAFLDPRVRAMLPRIHVSAYDLSGVGGFPAENHFGGFVSLTLRNGEVLTAQVDQPLGRTSANPLPVDRLNEKFRLCAQRVVSEESIEAIINMVERIETLSAITEVTQLIDSATIERG